MRKRTWKGWVIGGLLACLATGAGAIDVPLKYVKVPERNLAGEAEKDFPRRLKFRGDRQPDMSKRPSGNWKLPQLVSQFPIFNQVQIGSEERMMIIDQVDKADNYTRLYFDANGNGDLTDDPALKGSWTSLGVDYPVVECTLKSDGREMKYAFQPVLRQVEIWKINHWSATIGIGLACWYVGECDLDGKHYRFGLYDSNFNGQFDELSTVQTFGEGENQHFSLAGDELFIMPDGVQGGWTTGAPLCNQVSIGTKVYDMAVDMAQSNLTLTEPKEKLVALAIPKGIKRLTMMDEAGKRSLSAVSPEAMLSVPQGRYRLLSYDGFLTDPKGIQWQLSANATDKTLVTAADPKVDNPLRIGAPFRASISATYHQSVDNKGGFKKTDLLQMELRLRDQAGRQITFLRCTTPNGDFEKSNNNPYLPKDPTYEILDAKGNQVASGAIACGWAGGGLRGQAVWNGPQGGVEYKILVKYQAGPFKTECEPITFKF